MNLQINQTNPVKIILLNFPLNIFFRMYKNYFQCILIQWSLCMKPKLNSETLIYSIRCKLWIFKPYCTINWVTTRTLFKYSISWKIGSKNIYHILFCIKWKSIKLVSPFLLNFDKSNYSFRRGNRTLDAQNLSGVTDCVVLY